MNKKIGAFAVIVSAIALIVLIATFNTGDAASVTLPTPPVAEAETVPVQETVQEVVAIAAEPESQPIQAYSRFDGLSYRLSGDALVVSGTFGAGQLVTMYCDGAAVGTATSGADGAFSVQGVCKTGDDVYVSGADAESEHVRLNVYELQKSHRSSHRADQIETQSTHGVPEFSTWTLGFAIIGSCLGLAYMRRQ